MTQYCRYCSHMYCGDFNYCEVRKACYSVDYIKRPNHCSQFELNPMDALAENPNEYRPRAKKVRKHGSMPKGHQIDIWEGLHGSE